MGGRTLARFVPVLVAGAVAVGACATTTKAHTVESPTTVPPTAITTVPAPTTGGQAVIGTDDASVLIRLQDVATAELTLS